MDTPLLPGPPPEQPSIDLSPCRIRDIFRLYQIYRTYVVREDVLISQRLQRMLLIQGFMFAAAGTLLSRFGDALAASGSASQAHLVVSDWWPRINPLIVYGGFLLIVAFTGALTAYIARDGLEAANEAHKHLQKLWDAAVTEEEMAKVCLPGIRGGGSKKIHKHGKRHIIWLTQWFIFVWICISIVLLFVLEKHIFA
jgi:hypothetical protein